MTRVRSAEGFYEEFFPDCKQCVDNDFSDDDAEQTFTDSEDDQYVVDQGEGAKEPLTDR